MNHHTLSDSLMVMDSESLRFNYSLLQDTHILKMIVPFVKEKVSRSKKSEIMEMVQKESLKYHSTPTSQLKMGMIKELSSLYGIPVDSLNTRLEVAEQWERIIHHMHLHMSKKDKQFKKFIENNKRQEKLEDIVSFQMQNLVQAVNNKKLTTSEMEEIGESLEVFILKLPEQKQKQIAEKLGVNDVTSSTMQKLIATQGSAVVLAAIVQVAGFTFYTTLTSITASVFGLIGITLPFGVYMSLTSIVAVVANPLFLIPALLLAGGGMVKWQNDKLKKSIAPIVVMQIVMMRDKNSLPDWDGFLYG